MKVFGLILTPLLVLVVVYGAGAFYLSHMHRSEDATERFVLIYPRENFLKVAKNLEESGIIASERAFRWYLKLHGLTGKLKVGEYALRPNMTNEEIANMLTSGKSVLHKFTVPEGNNKFQIAAELENAGLGKAEEFLKAVEAKTFIRSLALPTMANPEVTPPSLEGYLYPDTYMVSRLMTEEEIIRMMVKRFKEIYGEMREALEKRAAEERPELTPHDLVTLASIVEKETGAGKERPLIASVFYNRLRKGMRLQSDPTTIYGMWDRDRRFEGNIRRSDLTAQTPYNTYAIPRLPRGPIANPGKSALQAVLEPAQSNFFYFVSRNDGTHVFSQTYGEHSKAVNVLQKNRTMREGKSWRDLPESERANRDKN